MKRIIACALTALFTLCASVNVFALSSAAPSLTLTRQEKEYFSELKTLRVLTPPDLQPYAYKNAGTSIDILQTLCDTAGISLEIIQAESYSAALTALENNEAELAAVKILPYSSNGKILPYLISPLQTVSHKQARVSEQTSLTIAQIGGIEFSYENKYSFVDEMTFTSVRKCLDSVRGRVTDVFLCDIYQLSVFSESFAARDLTMTTVPHREVTVGF